MRTAARIEQLPGEDSCLVRTAARIEQLPGEDSCHVRTAAPIPWREVLRTFFTVFILRHVTLVHVKFEKKRKNLTFKVLRC